VDPKYGERYRDLYERHWWWRARTEFIVEKLRRLRFGQEKATILDVGCGDGLFFGRLAEFGDVEGVEPCAELVRDQNPHRDRIFVGPFGAAFRPGKQYSLILMLDVLEHLEDPVAALQRVASLLEPGGKLLATVPSFEVLWTNQDVINHHFMRYTKRTFRKIARHTGLRTIEERYFYYWTCPVKLGLGVAERVFRLPPKPPEIPSTFINETLYRLSRAEHKIFDAIPMPFGSSLLVVAEKER
jgi:2-polyprenyl-3-methyl-5-hydroxy-6-metoxy-1,4-benzoquinol methylase